MKTIKKISLLFFSIACIPVLNATVLVQGNSSAPFSFNQSINAIALDKPTDTFYVGLASGGGNYAISKALPLPGIAPTFQGIATSPALNNNAIEFLTLSTSIGNTNPNLALVLESGSTPLTQPIVTIMNNSGTIVKQSSDLLDASGAVNSDGGITTGIVGLAANKSFIFSAVRPSDVSPSFSDFGEKYSGIAVVGINSSNLALSQTAAQPGDLGIKATLLDPTTSFVGSPNSSIEANTVSLQWDDQLQRLYIGLSVTTAGSSGNTANSVVVGSVSSQGVLTLNSFFPDSLLTAGDTTKIVGVEQSGATTETVTVDYLQIMHNSTGPSYLIINGGNGTNGTVSNTIYALPLVDVGDPLNANQGLLADKNSFNTATHRFETAVTSSSGLINSTDIAAQVGAGPLPTQETTAISGLLVVGDTVYVSLGEYANTQNDTGIFYSQALFDNTGKIIRWTPWTKRVAPFNSFPDATPQGQIAFFAVNASNGIVWMVNDTNNQTVRITNWDEGTSNSLVKAINMYLPQGCYSVLDLDQSTRGFTGATTNRYALFGGAGKLIFAQISQAQSAIIDSPQTVITDFSLPENLLVTSLPQPAGAIKAIEYTRQLTGTASNFFFVGTDRGLYAFANSNGDGFDVASLSNLNTAPFNGLLWQSINAIPGAVVDIKTTGNALYIMTTTSGPFNYTLYKVPFATNLSTMFANPIIIAQSGVGSLNSTLSFYGMQIISTATDGSTEQLVIGTNNGLYQSSRIGGVQNAINQTDANWSLIATSNSELFNGLGYIDNTPIPLVPPSTIWPYNLADPSGNKTYNGGQINQVAGSSDTSPFIFVPSFFNSITNTQPFFATTPVIYFWSDGARRFFITQNVQRFSSLPPSINQNNLVILPFDTTAWGVSSIKEQIVDNSVINSAKVLYWIRPIGASGIILMGTNFGVIAFE